MLLRMRMTCNAGPAEKYRPLNKIRFYEKAISLSRGKENRTVREDGMAGVIARDNARVNHPSSLSPRKNSKPQPIGQG